MLALVLSLGAACGAVDSSGQVIDVNGTVRYDAGLEGGWWYLSVTPSEYYTPVNLPDAFKVPGMRVQATVTISAEQVGFLPHPYVEIRQIHEIPSQ